MSGTFPGCKASTAGLGSPPKALFVFLITAPPPPPGLKWEQALQFGLDPLLLRAAGGPPVSSQLRAPDRGDQGVQPQPWWHLVTPRILWHHLPTEPVLAHLLLAGTGQQEPRVGSRDRPVQQGPLSVVGTPGWAAGTPRDGRDPTWCIRDP